MEHPLSETANCIIKITKRTLKYYMIFPDTSRYIFSMSLSTLFSHDFCDLPLCLLPIFVHSLTSLMIILKCYVDFFFCFDHTCDYWTYLFRSLLLLLVFRYQIFCVAWYTASGRIICFVARNTFLFANISVYKYSFVIGNPCMRLWDSLMF